MVNECREKDSILNKWYPAPANLFCLYEQISYCGDFNNLLKTNANFYLIPFHNLPLCPKLCWIVLLIKGIVFRKARIFSISIWATKLGTWNIISIFHICFPHKSKRNIIQLKHDASLKSQCFPFPHSLTSSISSQSPRGVVALFPDGKTAPPPKLLANPPRDSAPSLSWEVRSPHSRDCQGHAPSKGSGGQCIAWLFYPLVALSIPCLIATSSQSLPLWWHCLLLFCLW